MKKLFTLLLALTFLSAYSQEDDGTFSLDGVVILINNSLDKANDQLEGKDLDISSATITLKTSYDKSGGGGFKLFVKAKKKWQVQNANTMTFKYVKVKKLKGASFESFNEDKFESNLTKAIVKAAEQWEATTEMVEGLEKESFSIEVSFTAKKNTSGGLEFEILGAGIDLSGEYEKTAVHTIALTFN